MATIDISQIKALREKTEAGMSDCKKALVACEGDLDQAIKWLRERGQAIAGKKSTRSIKEGLVQAYIHPPGKLGVLLELGCETDFVARNPDFIQLAHDICMQIAAASPRFISREDVSEEALAEEREIFRTRALKEGKPEQIVDKIVEGRMGKYYEEACLLEQPFVKDGDRKINDLVTETIARFGENITVNRFKRFLVGENS